MNNQHFPPVRQIPFSLVNGIPNSIDLEKVLLGAIIVDGQKFKQVSNYINSQDFAHPQHRKLFQVMEELTNEDKPLTVNIILDKLKSSEDLKLIGGEAYFKELYVDISPNSMVVKNTLIEFAKRIKIKSNRRKMLEILVRAVAKTKEDGPDTDSELDLIIAEATKVNLKTIDSPYQLLYKIGEDFLISKASDQSTSIKTGFPSIDEIIGGFKKKQLITIAAETSMGKTSFSWHLALKIAKQKHPVAYLSLEMTKEEMYRKALSVYTGMSDREIEEVTISCPEIDTFNKLNKTSFKELPIYLTDQTLNVLEIKRSTRLLKEKHNLEVLFLDHLHFMQSKKLHETRNSEISLITSELKALAKELDIAIVILSQVNRANALRGDPRPILSDLRDSGSIAQDSDTVMFIYREGVHKPNEVDPRRTEIIVAKNRGGERNLIANLIFDGSTSTFSEPYYAEEQEMYEDQQRTVKKQHYLMKD